MEGHFKDHYHRIFCVTALAVWLAMGWPFLRELVTGTMRGSFPVPTLWLVPFTLFGAAVIGTAFLKLKAPIQWTLLWAQLAAVIAMAVVHPKDLMSIFLVIIAWQVAIATTRVKALAWVSFQTLAMIVTLAQAPNAHMSYVMALSVVLQLCCVFTAQTLRSESETARALTLANAELRSAQAIIAKNVRDAERLRISRDLHDAWGHDLTALGLQLEIASNVSEPGLANDHVMQAKGLARALLTKVRDIVATLRSAEGGDEGARYAMSGGFGAAAASHGGAAPLRPVQLRNRHHRIFSVAALAVTLALGSPILQMYISGTARTPALWLVAFALFAAAVLCATVLKLRPNALWTLLFVQVGAVAAMSFIASWAMMSAFLIIIAWQVAMATTPGKALGWVAFQTLAVIGALAIAPRPDLCWVLGKSFALQLFFVFMAQALRREAETARALAATNEELRAAQAIVATTVRDAERLRISRELHDAWGHELTALGLQLEIASHVSEPGRANDHVRQAKSVARDLLGKVRDVVSNLREAERCDLQEALQTLAHSIPRPAIHVEIASGVRVSPDQAHALMRCAQEAVTNAVKHSEASNLWLEVTRDGEGVRLIARNDGAPRRSPPSPGSGLLGMRERVESLGGWLKVRTGVDFGFAVEAWLPSRTPQAA